MLIWLLSGVWHGIYSWEVTVDLKSCRLTSFERGVWEHFPLIYKKNKKKMWGIKKKKCALHSVLTYKNIKWFPSTDCSWGVLFPCAISALAWNQPRVWAGSYLRLLQLPKGECLGTALENWHRARFPWGVKRAEILTPQRSLALLRLRFPPWSLQWNS